MRARTDDATWQVGETDEYKLVTSDKLVIRMIVYQLVDVFDHGRERVETRWNARSFGLVEDWIHRGIQNIQEFTQHSSPKLLCSYPTHDAVPINGSQMSTISTAIVRHLVGVGVLGTIEQRLDDRDTYDPPTTNLEYRFVLVRPKFDSAVELVLNRRELAVWEAAARLVVA